MSNNQTIKNLRVKNNETSISQVLPIGADAVNVELANRRNLQETIGNIDSRVNGSITNNLEVLSSAVQTLDSIKADTAMIGSPLVAETASQMIDTSHIYVYTGSESGYTAGNWYYHNGTNWVSGGVYNSTAVETDKTLKVENVAADSRAAGNMVLVSQTQPTAASNKIWIDPDAREIEIPTMDDVPSIEEFNELKDDLTVLEDLMGVQIVEVTNLLGNHGNFEDFSLSSSNWYIAYNESTASVTDNVLTFNANRQYGSLRHVFNAVADHKYYFFGTIKSDSPYVSISINVSSPIINPVGGNTFEYLSGIFTSSSTGSALFAIVDSRSITGTIYAEKCGVIDLTDCFGVGQEPTKDEMDKAMHKIGDFIINGVLSFVSSTAKAYENKKILFMGDSITAANLNNNGWCKYFNEIMKPSKSVNVAVSGATWSDNEDTVYDGNPSTYNQTNNTIGNQVEKIARGKDTSNPNYSHVGSYDSFDIIIISAGTNDDNSKFDTSFVRDSLVDTWSNPISYENINTKNAVGAMAYAYERLYTLYPDAEFYYCTPIQAYPAKKTWGSIQNKGSVMKEFGGYIPVTIIDTEKCGIFGNHEKYNTEGVDLYDGLHPNAHGAKKIGVYNANAIIQTCIALDN